MYRNDDPPRDDAAEEAAAWYDAIHEAMSKFGSFVLLQESEQDDLVNVARTFARAAYAEGYKMGQHDNELANIAAEKPKPE